MIRQEAIDGLKSSDPHTRLEAARFFSTEANGSDRRRIRIALRREPIPWIRRALERAEQTARDRPEVASTEEYYDPPPGLIADLQATAIRQVSNTIIHEVSTKLASLALEAPLEVPNYEQSETKKILTSLRLVIAGVRQLNESVKRPIFEEFDLAQELRDLAIEYEPKAEIRYAGQQPYLVKADVSLLLSLAVTNVLRNAVEAVSENEGDDRLIIINWGHSKPETWITVIDNGAGFDREPDSLIKLGESTKQAHVGYGLEIIRRAMHAMNGSLFLSNGTDGGARIELRWLDSNEDSAG